ncbi:MAG: hypothetical protein JWN68_3534 [Nocardioides sp.]|jgi:hypothetical protein|nr:hypothetical protein [Nocardioides sp.]
MESDLLAAFPRGLGSAVRQASEGLGTPSHRTSVRLVQDSYQRRWGDIGVAGEQLRIPYRHYQPPTRRAASRGVV